MDWYQKTIIKSETKKITLEYQEKWFSFYIKIPASECLNKIRIYDNFGSICHVKINGKLFKSCDMIDNLHMSDKAKIQLSFTIAIPSIKYMASVLYYPERI